MLDSDSGYTIYSQVSRLGYSLTRIAIRLCLSLSVFVRLYISVNEAGCQSVCVLRSPHGECMVDASSWSAFECINYLAPLHVYWKNRDVTAINKTELHKSLDFIRLVGVGETICRMQTDIAWADIKSSPIAFCDSAVCLPRIWRSQKTPPSVVGPAVSIGDVILWLFNVVLIEKRV